MPGVHHSSEGGGQGLLTIRCNSWFRIICPSGFKFFLASSLLSPGGDGSPLSWFLPLFLSTSLSLILISFSLPISHSPLSSSIYFSSIIPLPFHYVAPSLSPPSFPLPSSFLLHLSPTWLNSLSSYLCLSLFSVLLTVSGPLQRKFSRHANREYSCFSKCNQNARMQNKKKMFLSPSPKGKNLMFKIFFDSSGLVYNANF